MYIEKYPQCKPAPAPRLAPSFNNETLRCFFSYSAIYCTAYRLKSIMSFPEAKLQTLRIVGLINITSVVYK